MRHLDLIKVVLVTGIIILPVYAYAQCCNKCPTAKQEATVQSPPSCDTYVTNSLSHETLSSTEHRITEQVQKLFANESGLPDITVTTANGVVILSGTATSQAQVDKAASLAATVPCVTLVDTSKFYVK